LVAVINSVFSTLGIARPRPARSISNPPSRLHPDSGRARGISCHPAGLIGIPGPAPDRRTGERAGFSSRKTLSRHTFGIDNTVVTFASRSISSKASPSKHSASGLLYTGNWRYRHLCPDERIRGCTARPAEAEPDRWEKVFNQVGEIVWDARQAIERGDTTALVSDGCQSCTVTGDDRLQRRIGSFDGSSPQAVRWAQNSPVEAWGNMIALVLKEKARQ